MGTEMLLVLALLAAQPADSIAAAKEVCTPALASKAGGKVDSIDVSTSRISGGWTVIRGKLIAFIGMGPPRPGAASTHHLIRAVYDYICWVRNRRVEKTDLAQP